MEIRASGFVLYRREPQALRYLLLRNAKRGEWGLAKGKADSAESDVEAAFRETLEETGLRPEELRPHRHFRREIRYTVRDKAKRVVYLLSPAPHDDIELSGEHDAMRWADLDEATEALAHENLCGVLRDASLFLKDPILRRGLDPDGAQALLERYTSAESPVLRHSAQVASLACDLAPPIPEVDARDVEISAWLHDIGRSRDQGVRHALEGFRIVLLEGHPGYAPSCLSHYTKGLPLDFFRAESRLDEDLLREMWQVCDLEHLTPEEETVALADALVIGDRRGTIDERYRDLERRYGPSTFLQEARRRVERFRARFEDRAGQDLYAFLGIA